jgi:hypothetical protein
MHGDEEELDIHHPILVDDIQVKFDREKERKREKRQKRRNNRMEMR